jgi:hypothetical protein
LSADPGVEPAAALVSTKTPVLIAENPQPDSAK